MNGKQADCIMIFNIQRYSTHDGDGIRTLIFYKGCPLRCQWCSNPESQSFQSSIFYDGRSCKGFADCTLLFPNAIERSPAGDLQIKREQIPDPESLRDVCASRALTVSGKEYTVEELMTEVRKDLPFYGVDGGVTLSGGEPLAQGEELLHFLRELHRVNIGCMVETSLHVKWEQVERTIGLVETYLVDLKHLDPEKFRKYTLGDAGLVLENLKKLARSGARVVVRIPVIPAFNHSGTEIRNMVDSIEGIKRIREIHFLPYHSYGKQKYSLLGMAYQFNHAAQVGEQELLPYVNYAASKGFISKIGG